MGAQRQVQARRFVQRVPQAVATERRCRIRQEAKDKGKTPSATALALADWTLLIINVPAELVSLQEALVLARVRLSIELIFKLWKSQGVVDEWRSEKPARIVCEVYAKLLAMLLQQWLFIVGCWAYPERSLAKAAQVVRDHAVPLAAARARRAQLQEVIETICRILKRTACMNSRSTKPNTYQLLLALTTEEAQA